MIASVHCLDLPRSHAARLVRRTLAKRGSKTSGEEGKWRCMDATATVLRYEMPEPPQSQLR